MLRPAAASSAPHVAEIQGLYGAFSFPEKLLQKIWLRGDFDRARAVTADGRRVRIGFPGKWNLLGGPDFSGARLRFDEAHEITGDVEVHLRAADWEAHGHLRDRAYDNVVLHVVLFPPTDRRVTLGAGGREIPILALLPLLLHDLEEFAAEDAVETLSNRAAARLPELLGVLPARELLALLHRHAEARWQQKVRFARLRIQRLGWDDACHHTALEILGYRFNRPPMLRIAAQWPLAAWAGGPPLDLAAVFANEQESWSLQGVRPANHPRARLRQYAAWCAARADWPSRLVAMAPHVESASAAVSAGTRDVRREHGFAALREKIAAEIVADAIGGTRLDNLICDGLLPLLSARTDRELRGVWFHWFAGDLPTIVLRGLRQLGIFDGRNQPACHGIAQGLLGWLLEQDSRDGRSSATGRDA